MFFYALFSGISLGSQMYDYKVSKSWVTYIFTDQNGAPTVRMSTNCINNVTLNIDWFPGNIYRLALCEPAISFVPKHATKIDITIDSNITTKGTGEFITGNGFLWLIVYLPKNTDFIRQAILGNTLIFKIDSLKLKFSLIGFTEAFNYAMNLCEKIYKNYNNKLFREYLEENKKIEGTYL